ncbi:MAG: agmatine deiminase family protein [Ignavibacteria bacterium]|nr:agmatine deiminase family protein [Ignavibacteria bacterium]
MKKVFFILFLLSLSANIFSQDLPNYMTPEELKIYKTYVPPKSLTDDFNPPYSRVRTMAEFEEFQSVMITWTNYTTILSQMVKYIQQECKLIIVCNDSNSVKSTLTSNGVPLVNLSFLIKPFNTVWCRDYGPWCVYTNDADSLRMVEWIYNRPRPLDDTLPVPIARFFNVPLHQMINSPNNLTATGGNFMVDGNGTAFSSKLILNENPGKTEAEIDTMMSRYMGIKRYVFMDVLPYDGIHHIDMHMKLLDEETLMIGQYPLGAADGPQIELNLQYILNNYLTCYNRPYKIVRIPMPPSPSGQYPPSSDYYTYTNSLIVNKTVLVPIYGFSLDTTALRIYREAMPGYKVIGIDCNASIPSSGAIHCISKEIGVYEPIFISHSGIRNTNNTTTPYEVKALIKSKSGVPSAKLYWSTDTSLGYTMAYMTQSADTFRAYIPPQPLNTHVYYWISASSNSGRLVSKPLTAPLGHFKFLVTNATGTGNETGQSFSYKLYQNYPNPFNPVTTINFSLSKPGMTMIKVYDVLGREIGVLLNERKSAGLHFVNFDASMLTSGIYFYKITSGDYSETKKMMLIK